MDNAPRKEYRCHHCDRFLFEAVKVTKLKKKCPRCHEDNYFDDK